MLNVFHGGLSRQGAGQVILHLLASISKPLQITLKRINTCNVQQADERVGTQTQAGMCAGSCKGLVPCVVVVRNQVKSGFHNATLSQQTHIW